MGKQAVLDGIVFGGKRGIVSNSMQRIKSCLKRASLRSEGVIEVAGISDRSERNTHSIKYVGPILKNQGMDITDLAPSLLTLSDLIKETNRQP